MRSRRTIYLLCLGALLIAGALSFRFIRNQQAARTNDSPGKITESAHTTRPRQNRSTARRDSENQTPEPLHDPARTLDSPTGKQILACLRDLRTSRSPVESLAILKQLGKAIETAPESEAASAVLSFLASGEDAPTQLPFVVGSEGMMQSVPTFRIALLNILPALDPTAALESARQIMDRPKSQDEFAIALRNMAWNDLDGDLHAELRARFSQMLNTKAWLASPSPGFLEAFDVSLEIAAPPVFQEMTEIARQGIENTTPALTQAAFIALDRMVLRDPSLLENTIDRNAAWMDFAPRPRASLMSRLDITRPAQRQLFVQYLAGVSHGPDELEYFAEVFPNGNYLSGHRLVSVDEATPNIAQRKEMDRLILSELENLMISAPDLPEPTINRIRERLRGFVADGQ